MTRPYFVERDIIRDRRQYYIEKVKTPLRLSLVGLKVASFWHRVQLFREILKLAKKYPDPTLTNTVYDSIHVLINIREKHREYHRNPLRAEMVDTALRVLIDEAAHDPYYIFIFYWFYLELQAADWKPEPRGYQMQKYWTGPIDKLGLPEITRRK